MTSRKPGLDDPAQAAFAWARFRRVMIGMGVATAVVDVLSLVWLDIEFGPLSWITIAATVIGLSLTIMLAAMLMGLMFLSSGTGHDEAVDDFPRKRESRRRP
jgi:magnesium-transporting ATPase (P-type)